MTLIRSTPILFIAQIMLVLILFAPDISRAQDEASPSRNDFASWGLSYTHSDITMDRIGAMFSTAFSHKFSEFMSMEYGVHFTGSSLSYSSVLGAFWYHIAQHSIVGDVTVVYTPFASVQGLQISVGPSLRFRSLLEGSLSAGNITEKQVIGSYSFGGTAKIDYCLPLNNDMQIIFRAQSHSFLTAFSGEATPITTQFPIYKQGGSLSLGVFLRVGF
jgi:hypothetical protein